MTRRRQTRPVQWKTREPVRPRLCENKDYEGWLLPALVRLNPPTKASRTADIVTGLVLLALSLFLWWR